MLQCVFTSKYGFSFFGLPNRNFGFWGSSLVGHWTKLIISIGLGNLLLQVTTASSMSNKPSNKTAIHLTIWTSVCPSVVTEDRVYFLGVCRFGKWFMIALTDVINYTGVQEMSNLARFALGLVVHLIRSFWPSPSPFRFCVGSGSHKHLFWRSVFHSFFVSFDDLFVFSPFWFYFFGDFFLGEFSRLCHKS